MVSLRSLTRSTLALALVFLWLTPAPASAARKRARLGSDLEQKLATGSQAIEVIVHGNRAKVDALARRYGLVVKKYLRSGAVLGLNAGQLDALSQDEAIDHLAADAPVRASELTTQTIGADQVWSGAGTLPPLSGKGVGVALIDSGIDPRHVALAKRVVVTKDFIGGDGSDPFGHGTHVGGLIAGGGGSTPDTRDLTGTAPAARIINLRVLDGTGAGRASDVIEAIDWAIENQSAFNIRVINLSLGAPATQSYKDDPLCDAVERAVAAGIVVVAAAGNQGAAADGSPVFGSINSPGNSPSALTIGAVDMHGTPQRSDDTVAPYSAKGPTRYDLLIKPDLVAPGSRLVSAEAARSYLSRSFPERHYAGTGANAYMQLSGTSMAAGVASGAVALLLDAKPKLTPNEAKAALQLTSSPLQTEGLLAAGAGSINAIGAVSFASKREFVVTQIAGEKVRPGGLALFAREDAVASAKNIGKTTGRGTTLQGRTIVWGGTIIWGSVADTIVWGSANKIIRGSADTIVWGSADKLIRGSANTIVWGSATIIWGSAADTIIWGSAADTIVWGSADTIIWGSAADTIIWGSAAADTIIWGSAAADTIIWGSAAADTIIWGSAAADTIIWGSAAADTIIWGSAVADTIIWGS